MLTSASRAASTGVRRARSLPASIALLLVAVVLVSSACDTQAAVPPAPTSTAQPTITPEATDTPLPTSTPAPEWVTHTFGLGDGRTYKMDMPGVFRCGASSAPQGHIVVPCSYIGYYPGPLPPNHPAVDELEIALDASVVIDQTMRDCGGTPVTVGSNITGYQAYSANDTCDGGQPPTVRVFWKTPGVCYEMTTYANSSGPADFNTRYGAGWQHILASFVPPGPPAAGDTTCS